MDNPTTADRPPARRTRTPLGRWVNRQANALMFGGAVGTGERIVGYKDDGPRATAALAKLRGCVGKPIGGDPEALEWTIAGLPDEANDFGSQDASSEAANQEWAAYTALTLFALHQRSLHTEAMNKPGVGFGTAVGQLAFGNVNEAGIYRRFSALQTADDREEVIRHARSIIQLLHAKRIAFDYGMFAENLIDLDNPYRRDSVRLQWGRDYFVALRPIRTEGE